MDVISVCLLPTIHVAFVLYCSRSYVVTFHPERHALIVGCFVLIIAPAIKHDCSRHSEHWLSPDCQNLLRDAYHILLYPLCTVVLVFGILWLFAGIKWKKEPSFLVWLGGSAVFYIFVLHFIPIRIIQAGRLEGPYPIMSSDIGGVIIQEPMGWGAIYPEISIIGMIGSTLLLAYVVQLIVSRIDVWIFERKK